MCRRSEGVGAVPRTNVIKLTVESNRLNFTYTNLIVNKQSEINTIQHKFAHINVNTINIIRSTIL